MNEQYLHPDGPVDVSLGTGDGEASGSLIMARSLPKVLPILPVRDMSMFPRMVLPMLIGDPHHQSLVDQVLTGDKRLGLVAIRGDHKSTSIKDLDQIYEIGVATIILKMAKSEGEGIRLIAQGITRIRVIDILETEPFIRARVEAVEDIVRDNLETKALVNNLRGLFGKVLQLSPQLPEELATLSSGVEEPGAFADLVASTLNISAEERQSVVQALDVTERLMRVTNLINREIDMLELGSKIQSQVKEGLDKTQREYYLRQQLKAIKKELGEDEESESSEADEYRKKLQEKDLPDEVRTEAERELGRMAKMHPSSSEYHVITTYLEWILALPWKELTEEHIDIAEARRILENDHYDLDKVKRRILEYLSVRKLNPEMKGPILCLAGPPGVGKTSLGRSIARAMGRKFARISLGGVRDEAEIRGHRRTYVGAMPGRIMQSLRRVGTANPVFMLDEIDKLGNDFRGDPSSALLEVLDPEQNFSFSDHYLDLPFDLSRVVFITTANVLDTIPGPLLDRMEILEIAGYTALDKLKIAKRYLVPRQRAEHGLTASQFSLADAAVKKLITGYTREAGLRNLEREIGSVCRHAARRIAEGEVDSVKISAKDIEEIMGKPRFSSELALRTAVPGVATGLAWTPFGGDILFVEATAMPGKGGISITGQLGDVMRESAQAAISYVRANAEKYKIEPDYFSTHDLHIHVPAGAIPKDGPSAGVTLFTALISLITGRPVRADTAMTGEITLRGMVLPVGGIKEKVLAAKRAGIKQIILPHQNQKDLEDIPDSVREELTFQFAERMSQVARWAFKSGKN